MKATVGTIVVMGCVVGVLGWLAVERYRPRGEPALLSEAERREPCVLEEVSCRGTPAGRVHSAVFPAGEVSAHLGAVDLTVSCVGSVPAPVWDVGLAFADRVASGWYSVSWDSFSVAAARPADWSAVGGFLESPDAHPFVAAVLSPVPFSGEVVMGVLGADPRVVFNVTGLEFEAFATFDSERIRAVVGALAGACGGGPAPRG